MYVEFQLRYEVSKTDGITIFFLFRHKRHMARTLLLFSGRGDFNGVKFQVKRCGDSPGSPNVGLLVSAVSTAPSFRNPAHDVRLAQTLQLRRDLMKNLGWTPSMPKQQAKNIFGPARSNCCLHLQLVACRYHNCSTSSMFRGYNSNQTIISHSIAHFRERGAVAQWYRAGFLTLMTRG